jgi:hypothetical protein
MPAWRDRDTDMKVLWPGVAAAQGSRARQAALNAAGSAQYVDDLVSIGTQLVRPDSTQSSIFELE